jgi:hypothetical protein
VIEFVVSVLAVLGLISLGMLVGVAAVFGIGLLALLLAFRSATRGGWGH